MKKNDGPGRYEMGEPVLMLGLGSIGIAILLSLWSVVKGS